MARIKTEELLNRIAKNHYLTIILRGAQNGSFFMLIECADGIFIHENHDGSIKEYPRVDHALTWLKRMTGVKMIMVDIELWGR